MSGQVVKYYKEKGELVELLSEYNFYHPKYPYMHYIYAVGNDTLLIEVHGEAHKVAYRQVEDAIDNAIAKFLETRRIINYIHDYESLNSVSFYIRKDYANWLLKNLNKFDSVIFYKPAPIINFYINTKKVFGKSLNKVKLFNKIENLDQFGNEKNEKSPVASRYRNLTKENILSLLNDHSLVKSEDWVYNIDNGRLKHEALLFDENIVIRNIEGAMIESDLAMIEETSLEVQALIKPEGFPFISLVDLEKFTSISLKARRQSARLLEKVYKENKAIVFFNTNSNIRLAIKLTSAIKSSLRERVFIAKDLEVALILALSLKGVSIERVKEEASKNYNVFKKLDQHFNKKKYTRINELEREIDKMKSQRDKNIHNIFSMLSRISWDENFEPIHLDGVERDENYSELYKAIELLHKDIEELSKNYKIDS